MHRSTRRIRGKRRVLLRARTKRDRLRVFRAIQTRWVRIFIFSYARDNHWPWRMTLHAYKSSMNAWRRSNARASSICATVYASLRHLASILDIRTAHWGSEFVYFTSEDILGYLQVSGISTPTEKIKAYSIEYLYHVFKSVSISSRYHMANRIFPPVT